MILSFPRRVRQIPPAISAARIAILVAGIIVAVPASARCQETSRPAETVASLGQPRILKPSVSGAAGVIGTPSRTLALGLERSITHPVTGLLAGVVEGFARDVAGEVHPGIRVMAKSPMLGFAAGPEWTEGFGLTTTLRFEAAIRRGGLLGHGTMLRVDWMPAGKDRVEAGITVPLMQPLAGRTRPRSTVAMRGSVRTERGADRGASIARIREAAELLKSYENLYSDENLRALLRDERSYESVARAYHDALRDAFSTAGGDTATGSRLARRARIGLFDDLIVPFDAHFGQGKTDAALPSLASHAAARFEQWLRDSSGLADPARTAALSVERDWLAVVTDVGRSLRSQWKDYRLVWLPPQLALTPEQYDEQQEVDAIVARVTGKEFTDRNALTLLRSSELPVEIARSIFAARDYHVLWTHDVMGVTLEGNLDAVGYEMIADVYFPALTAAVQRYDSTGRLTQYFILLDQFYYESRAGRQWMTILEDPTNASIRLDGRDDRKAEREAHLRDRQRELRAAVAASRRLQADAGRFGADWLRNTVKVHVSIVAPSDFSFRSHRTIPPLPMVPDNVMREHRKIAFYDLDERDPYRGALLMMGVGIGEHYASPTWEDRGYRLRGPAALEGRAALRRALVSNGMRAERIPPVLRAVESIDATEARLNQGDYVGRAIQVHNDAGFGPKASSVARAMLYSLAPPGSVIIVPDPLWLSESWAAMLAGAAARGCHVVVIAPAKANAPASQPPILALERDMLTRMIEIRDKLGPRIARAGGGLRIGLYASRTQVDEVAARIAEIRAGLARAPWIRQLIPFDAKALAVLDQVVVGTDAQNAAQSPTRDAKPRSAQLHQKTQLIARPGAIAALVRQPGWEAALGAAARAQSRETTKLADQIGYVTPDIDSLALRQADAMLRGYEQTVPEAERKRFSFYFSVGTQNQDPRGIMLDGESSIIVSGFHAAAGLVDLFYLMARTTWIERPADLDPLLPEQTPLMRRIGRFFRFAM